MKTPGWRPLTSAAGPAGRGATVVEALVALIVLGLAAIAVTGLLLAATGGARAAALEGRRAELAQRAADFVRAGLAPEATGTFRASIGGEVYEAVYALRDDVAPGAIEVTVAPPGGAALTLGAAQPAEP